MPTSIKVLKLPFVTDRNGSNTDHWTMALSQLVIHNRWETIVEPSTHIAPRKIPWNKGKLVGQKSPLKLKDIWAIRAYDCRSAIAR